MCESIPEKQLIKDAWWGLGVFAVLNICVLAAYFIDGITNQFVFIMLFIQAGVIGLWLLPVFLWHLVKKRLPLKLATLKALASYKEAASHFNW